MKGEAMRYHADIQVDSDGSYWAEVEELPGCFASGFTLDELKESVIEAVRLYLGAEPKRRNDVELRAVVRA